MNRLGSWLKFLFVLLLPAFSACGGGTEGTGGVTLTAKVENTQAQPLGGVLVSIAGSPEVYVTDSSGSFSAYLPPQPTYDFTFEHEAELSTAAIGDVPSDAATVSASFVLGDDNSVTVNDVEIATHDNSSTESDDNDSSNNSDGTSSGSGDNSDDGSTDAGAGGNGGGGVGTPTPPVTPPGGGTPTPTPTPNPGPAPIPTPTPTPTPTPPGGGGDDKLVVESGLISSLSSSSIKVNGTKFTIDHDTEYRDAQGHESSISNFSVGDDVTVRGQVDNGILLAHRVIKN